MAQVNALGIGIEVKGCDGRIGTIAALGKKTVQVRFPDGKHQTYHAALVQATAPQAAQAPKAQRRKPVLRSGRPKRIGAAQAAAQPPAGGPIVTAHESSLLRDEITKLRMEVNRLGLVVAARAEAQPQPEASRGRFAVGPDGILTRA